MCKLRLKSFINALLNEKRVIHRDPRKSDSSPPSYMSLTTNDVEGSFYHTHTNLAFDETIHQYCKFSCNVNYYPKKQFNHKKSFC